MNIGEMLDELKRKALKDPKIRERFLLSRDQENPARSAAAWAMRSMRWIFFRPAKRRMPQ